ncbi:12318_t:CDS:2, partial [Entrophospora sp. SA101]
MKQAILIVLFAALFSSVFVSAMSIGSGINGLFRRDLLVGCKSNNDCSSPNEVCGTDEACHLNQGEPCVDINSDFLCVTSICRVVENDSLKCQLTDTRPSGDGCFVDDACE